MIRELRQTDLNGILELIQQLPDWFDDDARNRAIPRDIRYQKVLVAESTDRIVGFITLFVFEGRLTIGWLGVHPKHHNQGIGTKLIAEAENYGRKIGLDELATYTLGDSVDYPPYEATRRFYFRRGFCVYQRSQTDNPNCPEEMKIKKSIA